MDKLLIISSREILGSLFTPSLEETYNAFQTTATKLKSYLDPTLIFWCWAGSGKEAFSLSI
jgi:hypothetical protein